MPFLKPGLFLAILESAVRHRIYDHEHLT